MNFIRNSKEDNFEGLTNVLAQIRIKLSSNEPHPVGELADTGIIPQVLNFLDPKYYNMEKLIIECAWIISIVLAGETQHVNYLMSLDVVPKTIPLLEHPSDDVKENSIWILANIAGDSVAYREVLFKNDITYKLEDLSHKDNLSPSLVKQLAWLISNLCRQLPYPDFSKVLNIFSFELRANFIV